MKLNKEIIGDVDEVQDPLMGDTIPQEEVTQEGGGIFDNILKAKTGEGHVSDYINHPLNFDGSEGMAQILRGLTGLIGDLSLAIADVIIGGFKWMQGKKAAAVNAE